MRREPTILDVFVLHTSPSALFCIRAMGLFSSCPRMKCRPVSPTFVLPTHQWRLVLLESLLSLVDSEPHTTCIKYTFWPERGKKQKACSYSTAHSSTLLILFIYFNVVYMWCGAPSVSTKEVGLSQLFHNHLIITIVQDHHNYFVTFVIIV